MNIHRNTSPFGKVNAACQDRSIKLNNLKLAHKNKVLTKLQMLFQIPRRPVAIAFTEQFEERFMLQAVLLYPLKKPVVAVEFVNRAEQNVVMPPQGP